MLPKRQLVLAIDFDHTIADTAHPIEGRKMGPPIEGAKEALSQIRAAGHKIIIHSCNNPKAIRDWMAYYEIPYHYIWDEKGKPICDYYIDDRAITFTTWQEVITKLNAP